jgi:hypothetical protein
MVTGILPAQGAAQVGSVTLPAGRRHYSEEDDQLVAWVTARPLAEAGRAWLALTAEHPQTGLVPVLLAQTDSMEPPEGDELPYFGFDSPADVGLLERLSAADLLATLWASSADSPPVAAARAPFSRQFPGLAPAEGVPLPAADLERAVSARPPSYLGLVAADHPSDVPATVGWSVFGVDGLGLEARSLEIGAVLRSWETRFGARLLQLDSDAVARVLVERPPRTLELAEQIAAEHVAFADELDGSAAYTVRSHAARLIGAPIWTFWWD